ncbi:hypothetical protein [Oscillibacter sp.]|uniref:hypothetical protein n=1 Tax=Oscillibacter sp. TaxID=1945593 RepID=UPI0028A19D97|nr:hypothetical protein [Oscillibacter sp.]
MKKHKKPLVCIILTLALLFCNVSNVVAVDIATELDDYDIYHANFIAPQANEIIDNSSNITQAKAFVKSLDLSSRGFSNLTQAYIDELDYLADEGVQLESYSVAIPRAQEYYGTYDGYMFQAAYSYYSDNYYTNLTGKGNHEKWVSGAINILMNYALKRISVPFSVLSSASSVTFYEGARTEITNEDQITSRFIMIQDKDKKVSLDPYSFVPIIKDMVRTTHTSVVTYSGSPFSNPVVDASAPVVEIPSQNFYNKQYNLSRGYNHYVAGHVFDPITEIVLPATSTWN